MMQKYASAFLTIGEVADTLDIPQHVLRYWETRFSQIKPIKKQRGRRYYRPEDVDLLRGIRFLLYAERFTIRGVQRILTERGKSFVSVCWQRDSSITPVWQQTEHSEPQKSNAAVGDNHLKVGTLFDEPHRAEPQFEQPLSNDTDSLQAQTFASPIQQEAVGIHAERTSAAMVDVEGNKSLAAEGTQQQALTFPDSAFEGNALPQTGREDVSLADVPKSFEGDARLQKQEVQLVSTNHALSGEVGKLKSLLSDLQGMRDSYRKFETLSVDPNNFTKAG